MTIGQILNPSIFIERWIGIMTKMSPLEV